MADRALRPPPASRTPSTSPSSAVTASARRSWPRASRSSPRSPAASGAKVAHHGVRPRRPALARHRRDPARRRCSSELRGHDAILLGAIGDPGVPSGVLERGLLLQLRFALDHYVNLRPAQALPGRRQPARVARVAPGDIDFVVVREGTEGPYVGNGGALRVGHPARDRHRGQRQHRASASSGSSATPSPAPQAARAGTSPSCTSTTCWCTPATCGGAPSRRSAREFPEVEHRLPARRRRDDLPGHRPRPVRRHRHRQPLRRHHHRPRRRRRRRHRPGGVRQHQPGARPRRACSSRSTAPRPTSPARARPTRRRRSCRSRCCSTTSAATRRPPGSSGPSRPTSPSAAPPSRTTAEIGDAIAARLEADPLGPTAPGAPVVGSRAPPASATGPVACR